MVPVQSFVLYSRLYLVFHDEKRLRYILYLIIVSATALLPRQRLLCSQWNRAYQVMERLQVTGFCVQEFLISSVYIWEAVKLLQFGPEMHNRGQTVMYLPACGDQPCYHPNGRWSVSPPISGSLLFEIWIYVIRSKHYVSLKTDS